MFCIIHNVDKLEKLKVLLTCPICLKNMFENIKQLTTGKEIIPIDIVNKEIELKKRIINEKSISITCPHCSRFNIRYNNLLKKKIRKVEKNSEIENKNNKGLIDV